MRAYEDGGGGKIACIRFVIIITQKGSLMYLTERDYTRLASRVVTKHGGIFARRILGDEQLFGNVVTEGMVADWKYDPTRGRTRYSYRLERMKWEVGRTIKNFCRSLKNPVDSLQCDPIDRRCERQEEQEDRLERINYCHFLIRNTPLTRLQKDVLESYYFQGAKIPLIAENLKLSNQAVQQTLSRAVKRIRDLATPRKVAA